MLIMASDGLWERLSSQKVMRSDSIWNMSLTRFKCGFFIDSSHRESPEQSSSLNCLCFLQTNCNVGLKSEIG